MEVVGGGEYLTLHNIHSMSEPIKRATVEKINHTRISVQRTKWQPTKEAVICNVHYADFKGPSRVDPDILPIHFKRPASYPVATAPKKRRPLVRGSLQKRRRRRVHKHSDAEPTNSSQPSNSPNNPVKNLTVKGTHN